MNEQGLTEIGERLGSGAERKAFLAGAVSHIVAPSIRKNIEVQGRPPFAPLKPFTVMMKMMKGQPLVPGIATGAMLAATAVGAPGNNTTVTEDEAVYAIDVRNEDGENYAARFHYGQTLRQAARPFILYQPEDKEHLAAAFMRWVTEGLVP